MSEFKFSCPVCSQHLECDDSLSGSSIQCPACQNGITVPHSLTAAVPSSPEKMSNPPPDIRPAPPLGAPGRELKTSGLAKASIISSIVGVLVPIGAIPGIICGHLAKRQLNRNRSLQGRGLATGGLILGYIGVTVYAAIFLFYLSAGGASKDRAQEISCHNNLKYILLTQQMWGDDHRKAPNDTVTLKDLEPQLTGRNSRFSKCPGDGSYRLTVVGEPPTCSLHGAAPPIIRAGRQVFP